MNKRDFLKTLGLSAFSIPVYSKSFNEILKGSKSIPAEFLAKDEVFWSEIRKEYDLNPAFINLENGYYSITPRPLKKAFFDNVEHVNFLGSFYMRNSRFSENIIIREKLSQIAGCSTEEIIITRNTTESLDTVISGYDWKKGDEAVMAEQDYGSMIEHFDLQSKRFGLVKKIISVPNHPKDDEEIVRLYEKAITDKTRLLMVCHMINITGQILPVKKICDMAHAKGVDVLVDGAHAFAHLDFKIEDLGCDYYGTSLHKWLSVPLGAGFLYVNKAKIKNLWPIFGDNGYADDDIRKLNHTGTPAVHTHISILNSIEYLTKIGIKNKQARLNYLRKYWMDALKDVPNVNINTSFEPNRACGIGNVGLKNMTSIEMAEKLLSKYKIWTVGINGQNVFGCRITPNIYTSREELDKFIFAVKELAKV